MSDKFNEDGIDWELLMKAQNGKADSDTLITDCDEELNLQGIEMFNLTNSILEKKMIRIKKEE